MEEKFSSHEGIREVIAMLREFTEDDRQREQYRLHQEWLRSQRYEESAKKKLMDELNHLRKLQKEFEKEIRKREEAERKSEEAERKSKETERRSILAFRKKGLSDKEIADLLGMSEDAVKQIG